MPHELTPADVRCLRQLAFEIRLLLATIATVTNRARFRPFLEDAIRHSGLLCSLGWTLLIDTDHRQLRSLPHWVRCELLAARGKARVWRHRLAHVADAQRMLLRFETSARALEGRLWDGG